MIKFIVMRLLRSLLTIWVVLTLVFVFTRLTGSPVDWLLPDDAPLEARVALEEKLGLDRPLHMQYGEMLSSMFGGETQVSYRYYRPAGELYAERAAATLKLGLASLALAIVGAIPLGIFAAVRRNTLFDRVVMGGMVVGSVTPDFVLGVLMIFLFSVILRILPSGGSGGFLHYIMPVFAMATGPMAGIARLCRSSMLDVLRQDYLDLARSKGARERRVILLHALRNALIPVVTIIGLQFSTMIGGAVVVENVFSWPGIGALIVSSSQSRDFPVIQYGVMLIACSIALGNMLVDICYAFLDPRIRDKL